MTEATEMEKPKCRLTGTDGNVFSIISNVSKALKRAGMRDKVAEFQKKAFSSESYESVIALCSEYVEIE